MNCEQALDLIQRGLDGDLSARETAILEKHLSICSKCEHEKQNLEELSSSLSRLPQPVPPINIVERMLIQMESSSKKSRHRVSLWWIPGSVAAMIGGLLFWHLASEPTHDKMFSAKTESTSPHPEISSPEIQKSHSEPTPPIWSPDRQFQAQVEGHQVVVYLHDGEEYFRSSPWLKGGEVELLWTAEQQLTLHLKWREEKREEIRQIDLSQEKPIEVIEDGS